ncbi:MAG: NAD-dependent protein deacylase, partial [Erysipelotrichaceae bacterium]|nr:NAD-dependent protein deacylase [Erysipelotrichaceae bacterium]
SIHRNYCQKCHKFYSLDDIMKMDSVPRCSCGGIIKPDVVLYEESLDYDVMEDAVNMINSADTLVITGTSLVVYPAAGLVRYFHGKNLVVINLSRTSSDSSATLCINGRVGEVLGQIEVR